MRLSTLLSLPPLVFFCFIIVSLTPVLYVYVLFVVVVLCVCVFFCVCGGGFVLFFFCGGANLSLLVFRTRSFYVVQASLKLRVF